MQLQKIPMTLLFRLVSVIVLIGCMPFAAAQEVPRITSLTGSVLRLAPGESGLLRLRVQAMTSVWTSVFAAYAANDEYAFVLVGGSSATLDGCAALGSRAGNSLVTFDPTIAGGDLECTYAVRRSTGSINDLSMDMYPANGSGIPIAGGVSLRFGTVPDLRLDVRQESVGLLPDGRAQNLISLVVRQSSGVDLVGVSAGSCWIGSIPGFLMDGNIPGGCGGPVPGGFCFDGSYAFAMPTLPAQGSAACRIQLTSLEPYTTPLSYPIQLTTMYMRNAATGGRVLTLSSGYTALVLDIDHVFSGRFD